MSSIKTTQIDGDVSVGRNVAMGGGAEIAGSVTIGHDLKVEGWLEASNIKGIKSVNGKSAYELAVDNGYVGTEAEWLASLKGDDGVVLDGVTVFDELSSLDGKTTEQKHDYVPTGNMLEQVGGITEASRLTGNIILLKTIAGKYIDSSGTEQSSSSYATYVYVVRRGCSYIHVAAKIGTSAYVTVTDKNGNTLTKYQGASSPYTFDKDIYLDAGAMYVKIPAMVSGTLTVTDALPGDLSDMGYRGEVVGLLGTEIPKRQGYIGANGTWTKATSYFHYIIPIKEGVTAIRVKTNVQAFAYQFLASYGSVPPYTNNNSGTAPTMTYAENYSGAYVELEENSEHVVSVPRNAKYLYMSATANRMPLSLVLSDEHPIKGVRLTPTSVTAGKYIDINTEEEAESTATNLFTYDVTGKKMLYIKSRLASLGINLFVDGEDATVGRFRRQWPISGINTEGVYRVPDGAETLLLSTSLNNDLVVSDVSDTETDRPENMFSTKRVAFLGDSITAGVGATEDYYRYSSVFTSLARCYEINLGMNGTCLAANTKNGRTADRFITRATQANIGDADVIFVFGGTNDFTYDIKPIGDLFDEQTITGTTYRGTKRRIAPSDTETFAGALHELILHIRSVNPTARLVYIAPMTRGVWHKNVTPPSSAETNANGDYMEDFITAIRRICLFYSVPVVDMTSLMNQYWGNDSEDDNILESWDDDGIHPNNAGHKRIARILFNYCIYNLLI